MEDKWFVSADGPDAAGRAKLHIHRSWTGFKVAELDIRTVGNRKHETEDWKAEITAIALRRMEIGLETRARNRRSIRRCRCVSGF